MLTEQVLKFKNELEDADTYGERYLKRQEKIQDIDRAIEIANAQILQLSKSNTDEARKRIGFLNQEVATLSKLREGVSQSRIAYTPQGYATFLVNRQVEQIKSVAEGSKKKLERSGMR